MKKNRISLSEYQREHAEIPDFSITPDSVLDRVEDRDKWIEKHFNALW